MDDSWTLPHICAERCNACGACVVACENHALELDGGVAALSHPESCGGCGVCEIICPEGAIDLAFEIVWEEELCSSEEEKPLVGGREPLAGGGRDVQ